MSERKDEGKRGANRREFLGNAAVAAVAVSGVSTLLAACGESATEPQAARASTVGGPRANLGGGRDPGVTLHGMIAAVLGAATDIKIPALEKGVTTTYLQRVITDTDRTGTGLATVLKANYAFPNGPTVKVVVQDSRGRAWAPRAVYKNADLAYAMKDALATNPQSEGVLRDSLTSGKPVIALSKSSVVAFQDSAASDYYGNHLDIVSAGMSDIFNPTVSGIKITDTMRVLNRC
jgi:hypothetical protein